jgi:hypothetical protein
VASHSEVNLEENEKALTFKKLDIKDLDVFLDWVDDSSDMKNWELFQLDKIADNF